MDNEFVKYIETVFKPTLDSCQKFLYLTRGIEFQKESLCVLENVLKELANHKQRLIEIKDEEAANYCLSFQSSTKAVIHELRMWIAFKEDKMGDAWDELVNAQLQVDTAISAHATANNLTSYLKRLIAFEKLLFPPMLFLSPGFFIISSKCSICEQEYGNCNHLKGLPYMGEICARKITECKIEEVSLVSEPASKHARVRSISDEEKMRDIITWREDTSE
jgi:hypothetical protein